jgi:hypothetical protein
MLHLAECLEIARHDSAMRVCDRVRRTWSSRSLHAVDANFVSDLMTIEDGRIASDFGSTLAVLSSAMGLNRPFEDPAGS